MKANNSSIIFLILAALRYLEAAAGTSESGAEVLLVEDAVSPVVEQQAEVAVPVEREDALEGEKPEEEEEEQVFEEQLEGLISGPIVDESQFVSPFSELIENEFVIPAPHVNVAIDEQTEEEIIEGQDQQDEEESESVESVEEQVESVESAEEQVESAEEVESTEEQVESTEEAESVEEQVESVEDQADEEVESVEGEATEEVPVDAIDSTFTTFAQEKVQQQQPQFAKAQGGLFSQPEETQFSLGAFEKNPENFDYTGQYLKNFNVHDQQHFGFEAPQYSFKNNRAGFASPIIEADPHQFEEPHYQHHQLQHQQQQQKPQQQHGNLKALNLGEQNQGEYPLAHKVITKIAKLLKIHGVDVNKLFEKISQIDNSVLEHVNFCEVSTLSTLALLRSMSLYYPTQANSEERYRAALYVHNIINNFPCEKERVIMQQVANEYPPIFSSQKLFDAWVKNFGKNVLERINSPLTNKVLEVYAKLPTDKLENLADKIRNRVDRIPAGKFEQLAEKLRNRVGQIYGNIPELPYMKTLNNKKPKKN